jgi:hypothetical protein
LQITGAEITFRFFYSSFNCHGQDDYIFHQLNEFRDESGEKNFQVLLSLCTFHKTGVGQEAIDGQLREALDRENTFPDRNSHSLHTTIDSEAACHLITEVTAADALEQKDSDSRSEIESDHIPSE